MKRTRTSNIVMAVLVASGAVVTGCSGGAAETNAVSRGAGGGDPPAPASGAGSGGLVTPPIGYDTSWAELAGDDSDQQALAVAVDADGNVIVAGSFEGTLDRALAPLISGGGTDAFVAKYDATGALLWAKALGGPEEQAATDVAIDPAGNIVVVGSFEGSLPVGAATLTSPYGYSAFVAELDPNGNGIWGASLPMGAEPTEPRVAVDMEGYVVVANTFKNAGCTNQGVCWDGGLDIEIRKLGPDGVLMFDAVFPEEKDQVVRDVAFDSGCNIVLTGSFEGAIGFGASTLPAAGTTGTSIFAAKLDWAGKEVWLRAYQGGTDLVGHSVAVNSSGEIAVAGYFYGTTDFGGVDLTSAGLADAFVMKLDADGTTSWAKRFGDATQQAATAVAFDPEGNVLVGGVFLGTMAVGETALECKGDIDGFVAKLDPAGSPVWSAAFGDARGVQATYGIASGPAGEIVICGSAASTTDFGTGPLTAAGGSDAFVAELDR